MLLTFLVFPTEVLLCNACLFFLKEAVLEIYNSLLTKSHFIFLGEKPVLVQYNSILCPAPVLHKAGE